MRKISLVVSKYLENNRIFDPLIFRDSIFDRFVKLKKEFEYENYDLSTSDINLISESDIVIYASNMPEKLPRLEDKQKSYIILSESPFIRPDNFDVENHKYFQKIFTWHDDFVDGKTYIKLNYAHLFPKTIKKSLNEKVKLCSLIAGNKKPPHASVNDLYSEREKAIRWFENRHPSDFDLYGVGWDKHRFYGPKLVRALNRMPFIPEWYMKLLGNSYPSYKGRVENKNAVLEKYKFSICYENAKDIPGYITEKIFDSFFAGCIPVYWGANNILKYVPGDCFIDSRDFATYETLYDFMANMTDIEYLDYLNNIENYLNSGQSYQFKSESFVETVVKSILGSRDFVVA
jgi:hypothetical protein